MGFVWTKSVILAMAMVLALVVAKPSQGVSLCNMDEDRLQACKPAVTEPNPVPPSADCCKALSGADLPCLCSYKESPILPALGIDPALCMGLPANCNLPTPVNC